MKKRKTLKREAPFQYLRRKENNEPFTEETVRNWYIARAYVLDRTKDISFSPGSEGHLHAVVAGDSPLMLAVLRQLALSAHYANFEEYDLSGRLSCRNRTVVTLLTRKDPQEIVAELAKEENLCNLPKYCKYSLFGKVHNPDSYIDIELEIVREQPVDKGVLVLTEEDVTSFLDSRNPEQVFSIDTRKAVFAKRAYTLGTVIDNIPYEDINSAERYNRALATFQHKVLKGTDNLCIVQDSEWKDDLNAVKNGLSNIFCADCFESRELAIRRLYSPGKKNGEEVMAIWEKYNFALSQSEHGRWVVEKLILGYRPLDGQERVDYAEHFGTSRSLYSKKLKDRSADPAHIDLCSYRALRRVDPDNMKYDSFLMLAIPLVLEKIRLDDKKQS